MVNNLFRREAEAPTNFTGMPMAFSRDSHTSPLVKVSTSTSAPADFKAEAM